jgi:hypothetical protein
MIMTHKQNGHSSRQTTDHDEIKKWAEDRDGKPATIAGTPKQGEEAGLLRIDFPSGASNPPLEPISWEDFFNKFDEANLAMVYEEQDAQGKPSYFCKFVERETATQ